MRLRKSILIHLLIVCLFSIGLLTFSTNPVQANQDDKCGFGKYLTEDANWNEICEFRVFSEYEYSDGFSTTFQISTDDEAPVFCADGGCNNRFNRFFYIECTDGELLVGFDVGFVVPVTKKKGIGTALVKIDNGAIRSFAYSSIQGEFSPAWESEPRGYWYSIRLSTPQVLTKALLKGAKRLSLKIPVAKGSVILVFALSDLVNFQAKFKSRGCQLR